MNPKTPARPALQLVEDAVDILRSDPLRFLLPYYLGSLPFYLALLFFVTDMQSAFAESRLVPSAVGLSILFMVMKLFQSLFATRVYHRMAHSENGPASPGSLFRLFSYQAAVQASGFIVLPLALLATLPYVTTAAFYQNALAVPPQVHDGRSVTGRIWRTASHAPAQNHMIYLIFLALRLGVLINIGILVYTGPGLLKSLSGIETTFSMGGFSLFNSTSILTILVLTQLVTDPLYKAVHAIRCFYAQAESSGEDLKAELLHIRKTLSNLAVALVFTLTALAFFQTPSFADQSAPSHSTDHAHAGVSPEALETSIGDVIHRREFAWRMPTDKTGATQKKDLLDRVADWIGPWFKKAADTVSRFFEKIAEWLKKIMPEPKDRPENHTGEKKPLTRTLLYGLLGAALLLLAGFILRTVFAALKEKAHGDTGCASPVPDVSADSTQAGDLPASAWRAVSLELLAKGEYRLAIRAFYFETLASLADSNFLSIAQHKSNREYQRELSIRAHEKETMNDLFQRSVAVMDRVWYGNINVGRDDAEDFARCQERIMAHAR